MKKTSFRYIFGPVYSWRLGMSLGVDPISQKEKICNFNCIYCQLGETNVLQTLREVFVPTRKIVEEVRSLSPGGIDYITFSGRGEPTLAKNLGEMIQEVRKIRPEKIAVITNSTLIARADVQKDLMLADFVLAKLDAHNAKDFAAVNRGIADVVFADVVQGLCAFRKKFKGKLGLQIMFVKHNMVHAKDIAEIARKIHPDEVQLNTPLRPCATKPLTKKEMNDIKRYYSSFHALCVYDVPSKPYHPFDEIATASRHGSFQK